MIEIRPKTAQRKRFSYFPKNLKFHSNLALAQILEVKTSPLEVKKHWLHRLCFGRAQYFLEIPIELCFNPDLRLICTPQRLHPRDCELQGELDRTLNQCS